MGQIIGIDLGTTNSCVAVLDGDTSTVIPNTEGSRTTPSMVAFAQSGERLVGHIAKRQAITNSGNTIFAIKRLMGRKLSDPEIRQIQETCPYQLVESENGDVWIEVRDKPYSPSEISAMILVYLKRVAEDYIGNEVTDAVVTVPAYFDDSQRQATKVAGEIAGLNVRRIINEPTAAALAYGLNRRDQSQTVAVYDLGGGTFDISILDLSGGTFQVRSTNGNTHLGGEDFDQVLVKYLAETFKEDNGLDLLEDRMALQRLKEAAEKAKCELSVAMETEINLPFIAADAGGPKHLVVTLTRRKLEDLVSDIVEKTLEPCGKALDDAGLKPSQVDEVILVGGQTRMPLVQRRVAEFFGRSPNKSVNPDEVVAIGAAIQGSVLDGTVDDVLLLDVTPLSLGVETAGGVFTRIIPRNTPIPARRAEVFSTAADNQPLVNVHVLQGEREMAADNKSLEHFQLLGIPPAPRGVPQIEVTFSIDANGILDVSAKDLATNKVQTVRVVPTSGLTEDDVVRIQQAAEEYAEQDRKRRELADLKNNAETLVYTTEKALEEYGDMLDEQDRDMLDADLVWCKQQLERPDVDADSLKEGIERLESSAHRIYEAMYEKVSGLVDETSEDPSQGDGSE
ncbi:MAG: molecular chaperone DnaK [Deltaproteobacteria bacterium]|nr:molecular chaperone DnaK [Deltaproteobacteria bacterium]